MPGQWMNFIRDGEFRLKIGSTRKWATDCATCRPFANVKQVDASKMLQPRHSGHYPNSAAVNFRGVPVGIVLAYVLSASFILFIPTWDTGITKLASAVLARHPESRRMQSFIRT